VYNDNKITKVIRLEILKPSDGDWHTAGRTLRDIQAATARALNYCIREHYLEAAPKSEKLKLEGKKIRRKDVTPKQSKTAELGTHFGQIMNSYVYGTLDNVARQRWNNDWFDVLVRGEKSITSYRSDCPIFLRATGVRIWEDKKDGENAIRVIGFKLRPKTDGKIPEDIFILKNQSFDDSRKAIWDLLISKEYKLGMVQVLYKKRLRKWFANISYSFTTTKIEELDPKIRVGVDLGLAVPVCLAANNSYIRAYLREEGETIQSFRRQIERRRHALRRNERGILERRSGHGRKHKIETIEKLRELELNFRRTANHRLSSAVVNFAIKQNASTIVMEDLSGYREGKIQQRVEEESEGKKESRFLEEWNTFELQTMIEQKASEYGIVVEKVKPSKTSQRCSRCGYIDTGNRNDRSFKCLKCGQTFDADYNAARNLATPDIEKLISSFDGGDGNRKRQSETMFRKEA